MKNFIAFSFLLFSFSNIFCIFFGFFNSFQLLSFTFLDFWFFFLIFFNFLLFSFHFFSYLCYLFFVDCFFSFLDKHCLKFLFARRTCLIFVCVHLLHEVTQRVHTTLDVITITHLCDSRLHQSSKKSVSPQHTCVDLVPSCVVVARVARTTLCGFWLRASRMVAELLVALRRSTVVHHDHWWVACEVGQSRQWSGAGTTETGLSRTRVSGSPTAYPARYLQEAVRPARQQESSTRALLANRSLSQDKLRNGQRGKSSSRRSGVQRTREWQKCSTLLHGKVQILLSTTIYPRSCSLGRAADQGRGNDAGHTTGREREGEWGRNTLQQRLWRNAIAEFRTLSHLPSGSLSCMGLAAPTYGNLNHLCDWSEHGEWCQSHVHDQQCNHFSRVDRCSCWQCWSVLQKWCLLIQRRQEHCHVKGSLSVSHMFPSSAILSQCCRYNARLFSNRPSLLVSCGYGVYLVWTWLLAAQTSGLVWRSVASVSRTWQLTTCIRFRCGLNYDLCILAVNLMFSLAYATRSPWCSPPARSDQFWSGTDHVLCCGPSGPHFCLCQSTLVRGQSFTVAQLLRLATFLCRIPNSASLRHFFVCQSGKSWSFTSTLLLHPELRCERLHVRQQTQISMRITRSFFEEFEFTLNFYSYFSLLLSPLLFDLKNNFSHVFF